MVDEIYPDLASLLRRLEAVERRLNRLEASLRGREAPPPRRPPYREPAPSQQPVLHEPEAERGTPEEQAIPTVLPVDQLATSTGAAAPEASPSVSAPGPTAPVSPGRRLRRPPSSQPAGDLEHTIGLKWAGWIGAIVLVIGVGLGINFAYERGWFGHLPVELRLALMSLGGFALLVAGEVVYRRVNVLSAVGLFGAGVAVLFLVSYAGNTYYGAYSYQTAFVFALLTALIGSGVAIRSRLVSIAVLSQIGGQLAPLVLSTGERPGLALLAYLLMLQVVALILALWGGTAKWWVLRGLSLAATSWWVLVALTEGRWGPGLANEVLWFAVVYAAAYQGELVRSALLSGVASAGDLARGFGTIFSLLVTAGLAAVALHVFYDYDSAAFRGGSTLLLAGVCLAGGFFLRVRDNVLVQVLTIGYRVQGVALLILFVPVTFTGVWISLAWAILSLAFAVVAARFDRGLARGGAVAAWLLAVGRLLIDAAAASYGGAAGQTWLVLLDHPIRGYTVIAWLLAGAGLLTAWLLQTNLLNPGSQAAPQWQQPALFTSIAAGIVWLVASLDGLPPLGGTFALIVWAWLLFGADFIPQRLALAPQAPCILLFASFKWALVDALAERMSPGWSAVDYWPVLNPVMGLGLLLAVSLAAMAWLRQAVFERLLADSLGRPISSIACAFAVAGLMLAILSLGLSLEVDRLIERAAALGYRLAWPVEQLKLFGWTILWLAAVLVLARTARQLRYATFVPWVLLLLVGGKFLLIDMLSMRLLQPSGPAPVRVVLNYQVLTAAVLLAGLVVLHRLTPLENADLGLPVPRQESGNEAATGERATAYLVKGMANLLALLIVLMAGTLEIDRAFAGPLAASFSDPGLANQVAISIFWSLFAIVAVAAGFRFQVAWLRYFGLSLFAVTLAKVMLMDLSQVRFGYRILSLLGLGLLLLATSVLYGKLGPKLLLRRDRPENRRHIPQGAPEETEPV